MALSAKELVTQYKDEYEYCEKAYMEAWNSIIVDVDENASENKKTAAFVGNSDSNAESGDRR